MNPANWSPEARRIIAGASLQIAAIVVAAFGGGAWFEHQRRINNV